MQDGGLNERSFPKIDLHEEHYYTESMFRYEG